MPTDEINTLITRIGADPALREALLKAPSLEAAYAIAADHGIALRDLDDIDELSDSMLETVAGGSTEIHNSTMGCAIGC
ncbi:MAG: Nif11-like leader peptide family natural product precursor [Actinobacteria bacterium]|uniref:Unannotated protein n=1 Tax=freshwater metagenome TaxID=449393 RepID=A0A6J7KHQ0_9ZZZZ|nr:Nif11-like leader peptide family natural product precursor [Actinomycetota bacterium]